MGCITKSLLKLGGQNFGGTDGVDYNSPQLTMVLRCGQMVFMQSPCKVVVLVPPWNQPRTPGVTNYIRWTYRAQRSWLWRCGYGSIPIDTFLVGWTSIYQLFLCSLGTRVLTHPHFRQNVGTPWFCFVSVQVYPNRSLDLSGRLCINRWYVDPLCLKNSTLWKSLMAVVPEHQKISKMI